MISIRYAFILLVVGLAIEGCTTVGELEPPLEVCRGGRHNPRVVFIHGWRGDNENTWQEFPKIVCDDESFPSATVVSLDYPTFMTQSNLSIPDLASWLDGEIETMYPDDNGPIVLIAHSMGGLIARELIVQRSLHAKSLPLLSVDIATPHAGTSKAKLANTLGLSGKLASSMSPRSAYLNGLETRWIALATSDRTDIPKTPCFWSAHDDVVPRASAFYLCSSLNPPYPQWDHRQVVKPPDRDDYRYSRPVAEILAALLGESSEPTNDESIEVLRAVVNCRLKSHRCEIDILTRSDLADAALIESAVLEVVEFDSDSFLGTRQTIEPTIVKVDLTGVRKGDKKSAIVAKEVVAGFDRIVLDIWAEDVPKHEHYFYKVQLKLRTNLGDLVVVPESAEADGSFWLGLPWNSRRYGLSDPRKAH